MSARYRFTRVTIWGELRHTSEHAKVVLWNLMTGTQSNMAGIFVLSRDTLARETDLTPAEAERALAELEKHPTPRRSWIVRDAEMIWVRDQLKGDPSREKDPHLSNPRHRAAVISIVDSLPQSNAIVKKYRDFYHLPKQRHSKGNPIGKPIGKRMPMPFKDSEFRTPEKEKNSGEGKGEHERKNHAPARPPALRSLEGLAPAGSANWDGSNHENPVWQGIYAHYANVSPHKSAAELIRMADEEFARRQGA